MLGQDALKRRERAAQARYHHLGGYGGEHDAHHLGEDAGAVLVKDAVQQVAVHHDDPRARHGYEDRAEDQELVEPRGLVHVDHGDRHGTRPRDQGSGHGRNGHGIKVLLVVAVRPLSPRLLSHEHVQGDDQEQNAARDAQRVKRYRQDVHERLTHDGKDHQDDRGDRRSLGNNIAALGPAHAPRQPQEYGYVTEGVGHDEDRDNGADEKLEVHGHSPLRL